MRYLLFGDSIAWGHNDILNRGWAGRLKKHIHKNIINKKRKGSHFRNYAVSGYTSRDVLKIIDKKIKKIIKKYPKEEITIIISIGTNDSQKDITNQRKGIPKKEFKENISKLIKISKIYTEKIFIFGILPVNEELLKSKKSNYKYYNKRIIEYNEILKQVSRLEKVKFKEFFETWIKKDTQKLFNDGLHPNKLGHHIYFKEVKDLFSYS